MRTIGSECRTIPTVPAGRIWNIFSTWHREVVKDVGTWKYTRWLERKSEMAQIHKQNGDVIGCGRNREIKLMKYAMKVLQTVMGNRLKLSRVVGIDGI